jgi:hypothetical protein
MEEPTRARRSLGENLKSMPVFLQHYHENLANKSLGHIRVEEIAHAVDEDDASFFKAPGVL